MRMFSGMRPKAFSRMRPRSKAALVLGAMLLTVGQIALLSASINGATALAEDELTGVPVPTADTGAISAAAESCPALTGARLAGQLMMASGFESETQDGNGVAGLIKPVWQRRAPYPGANRGDREANIIALAHHMCDLVADSRGAGARRSLV